MLIFTIITFLWYLLKNKRQFCRVLHARCSSIPAFGKCVWPWDFFLFIYFGFKRPDHEGVEEAQVAVGEKHRWLWERRGCLMTTSSKNIIIMVIVSIFRETDSSSLRSESPLRALVCLTSLSGKAAARTMSLLLPSTFYLLPSRRIPMDTGIWTVGHKNLIIFWSFYDIEIINQFFDSKYCHTMEIFYTYLHVLIN